MVAVPMPGPGFMQVCWLVPDLEAAIDTWATTAGVGPFFWFDGVPFEDGRHRGVPAEFPASTAAIAYAGDVQIELVCQENDAPGVFRDVFPLGEHGLHHLARICHDYEAERDAFVAQGHEVAFEGTVGGSRTCWIDTTRDARLHGRAPRAQRRAGRLVRPHAQGRGALGRRRPHRRRPSPGSRSLTDRR